MKQKGFTLLELLVVIGIIGILVSLITVSFSNAQKSSRDSRRRQDIVAIQNAMEQYYSQNNFTYPACNCIDGVTGCCDVLSPYFANSVAPVDPLSTSHYQYSFNVSGSDYTVSMTPEKCTPAATPCPVVSVRNLQ